jgi:tetratricopeptide (TPR) repeat protein
VLKAITCAGCGAIIRADRPRCLRCGEPLRAAATSGSTTGGTWRSWQTLVIASGCVALAGISLAYFGRATAPAASIAIDSAPVVAATAAEALPAPERFRPDPVTVAFEERRTGAAAYNRGDTATALAGFLAAVEANPDDPIALNNLGQLLVRNGQSADAVQYFDRAITLAQGTWAYRFNRARAYAEMKEWPRAIADYREAARLFPGDYATEFNLARALQANGDLAGAIAGFERAVALAPGQADFHLSHGRALEAAKRPTDAISAYRRYLQLEPTGSEADKVKAHIAQLEGLKS